MESCSNGGNPEDRTPCTQATTSTSRIAESWSNAGNRADRTRLATVDIRQGRNGAESWSNTQERDDRTRSVGTGRRRRLTASSGSDCGCGRFCRSRVRRRSAGREGRYPHQRNSRGPAGREVEDDDEHRVVGRRGRRPTGRSATTGGTTSGTTRHGRRRRLDLEHRFEHAHGRRSRCYRRAPTDAHGTSITVTFDGTLDDVKNLADAIQNDPTDGGRTTNGDGTSDGRGRRHRSDHRSGDGSELELADRAGRCGHRPAELGQRQRSVRVNQPGNTGAVTQTNDATAIAKANVSSNWGSGSAGTTDTQASAWADTAQSGASNTNVNVRVDSNGDIGNVTQSNDTYAGAQATGTAGAGDAGTAGALAPIGTRSREHHRRSSAGTPNSSGNASTTGGSTAGTSGTDASATHTRRRLRAERRNVNVSVRVNSAGEQRHGRPEQHGHGRGRSERLRPARTEVRSRKLDGSSGTNQNVTTSGSADASNNGDLSQADRADAGF